VSVEEVLARVEARRVDWRLALAATGRAGRDAAERHDPFLSSAAGLCDVDHDAEDPGAQRRAGFKTVESLDHGHPGFLNDLFGNRSGRHVLLGDAE
jgi:hypothetical protein